MFEYVKRRNNKYFGDIEIFGKKSSISIFFNLSKRGRNVQQQLSVEKTYSLPYHPLINFVKDTLELYLFPLQEKLVMY